MPEDRKSLTGVWQGVYSYPFGRAPTAFVATIIDCKGQFSGTAHETVPEHGPALLFSTLSGHRDGRVVSFRKEYAAGSDSDYSTVEYAGTLSADGARVEGRWTIRQEWSGQFVMTRRRR